MFKIAITGPESSGKSNISKALSSYYNCSWVPEYARTYLEKKTEAYQEEDLLIILKGQLESESNKEEESNTFLFCDTDPLVIKIWSQVKYGRVNKVIEEAWKKHHYDFYLLMYPDIDWVSDPFRESKENRIQLFDLYKRELDNSKRPYFILTGVDNKRLENATKAIDTFFSIS